MGGRELPRARPLFEPPPRARTSGIVLIGQSWISNAPPPGTPIDQPEIVFPFAVAVVGTTREPPYTPAPLPEWPPETASEPSALATKVVVPAFIATATEDEAPTCLTFGPMNVSTVSSQPHAESGVDANVYAPSAMKSYLPALNALKCGSPLPAQVDIVPSGMSGAQVQADCAAAPPSRPSASRTVIGGLLTIIAAAARCGVARGGLEVSSLEWRCGAARKGLVMAR